MSEQEKVSRFPDGHPRGPNGGPMFLGEELCPVCECCSLGSESCDTCGGDGYVGTDSPEGWDEGDIEECDVCLGEGGWMTCLGGCNIERKIRHEARESKPTPLAPESPR